MRLRPFSPRGIPLCRHVSARQVVPAEIIAGRGGGSLPEVAGYGGLDRLGRRGLVMSGGLGGLVMSGAPAGSVSR
jgi:hypothetical protein